MGVFVEIKRCDERPHHNTKLTKGYGYAEDYYCGATYDNRKIAGYVETPSEIPTPPQWCPFRKEI